ncbi:Holliday junction resolvase RecU [Clostridia bacterium]|nr:Holliday junction resolvase RecU [Clostridia bacterium]GHV39690.1 Holliday junction resolvase RecU [Clostridia bacterium]
MAWNTSGLRGSTLEELINMTNESYRKKGLAVVQKVPTPITPVEVSNSPQSRNITLAYFGQKSTVDYIGAAQGFPLCFDAKETSAKSLPVNNIHEHQVEFMKDFERQGGLSFLIVHFRQFSEYYFLPFIVLQEFFEAAKNGGRKSIPYDAFQKKYLLQSKSGFSIHYLEGINTYLDEKENRGEKTRHE